MSLNSCLHCGLGGEQNVLPVFIVWQLASTVFLCSAAGREMQTLTDCYTMVFVKVLKCAESTAEYKAIYYETRQLTRNAGLRITCVPIMSDVAQSQLCHDLFKLSM